MRRTATSAALCLALIYATATAGGAAGEPQPPPSSSVPAADAARHSITLITGDRVVLDARGDVTAIRPGRGRGRIAFSTRRFGGHTLVVPADASRLIGAGKLDRRLFDVTTLATFGYADARRRDLPLIVETRAKRLPRIAGVRLLRDLPSIGGAAIRVAKDGTAWRELAASKAVEKIWLDGVRKPLLDQTVPQIGAPEAWQAGYTGQGVKVAVLDGGVDASHPDLAGQVVAAKNFTPAGPADQHGHGTHVAATIASTGAAAPGRYRGVAPEADLLSGKVCEDVGCEESAILAGMQWAAAEQHARVISMSIGGPDFPDTDPLEAAVDRLTAETGALFVIAAGNDGPGAGTVNSPGSAEAALAVGAVDKQDELAWFSSHGPRIGDNGLKPDLTAPGVDIVAARAAGTEMGEPVGEHHVRASGTSMATPHVAGAAALLAQQHPDWKAGQLKAALMNSAKPAAELTAFEQGTGRVDIAKAFTQQVFAQPASLSYGLQKWPHTDDQPITKAVTYRNEGDQPVELALSGMLTGPDEPAPDGALRLSASTLRVPAHGTAEIGVTVTTNHAGPDGLYTGRVEARGDGIALGTSIAVQKEIESYDLTIRHLDRAGDTTDVAFASMFGLDVDIWVEDFGEESSTYRLPKGRYLADSTIFLGEEFDGAVSLLRPEVLLDRDITLTFDARDGKPFAAGIPRTNLPSARMSVGYALSTPQRPGSWDGFAGVVGVPDQARLFSAQLGSVGRTEKLNSAVTGVWASEHLLPDGDEYLAAPDVYVAYAPLSGRFPTGFARKFQAREFATLDNGYAAQQPGARADAYVEARHGSSPRGSSDYLLFELPTKLRWHVNAAPDVRWEHSVAEFARLEDGELLYGTVLYSGVRRYTAGRTYRDRWNAGVFGPGFPPIAIVQSGPWAFRSGDTIDAVQPLYTDQHNHAGDSGDLATTQTTLYRDGAPVATNSWIGLTAEGLPPEPSEYRLETTATRSGEVSPFASESTVAWTFRSGRTEHGDDARTPLPLWAIRFQPRLDDLNRNPDGRVHLLPVVAQPQPGSAVGQLRKLTVEISTDDGRTWSKAPVLPGLVVVRLPAGTEWVSLRANAVDSKGNSVEQTLVRAYRMH